MARRRTRRATGRTTLAIGITSEPLSGASESIVRIRIDDHGVESELTCTTEEVPTIVTWAVQHRGSTQATDLPVPECHQPPWQRNYRWTMAAEVLRRADEADVAHRLTPREVSDLVGRLHGRVGWLGHRALARELGIDVRDLRRAISRTRLSPAKVRRIRVALAAQGIENAVVLPRGRGDA